MHESAGRLFGRGRPAPLKTLSAIRRLSGPETLTMAMPASPDAVDIAAMVSESFCSITARR